MTSLDLSKIERYAQNAPILVALSGGGDSTALLYILIEAFGRERLKVCVIDHALRQGSAADANLACERARALGVAAQIKTLSWPVGAKISQATARDARYRALCEVARQQDCRVIALGHNADDQAETVLMRSESGSSWRGLAGMRALAPAPIWPEGRGLWLARPLLNLRRADLRAILTKKNAAWIEDPANANPDFARVRMRVRLAVMEAGGFDPMALCTEALAHQSRAATLDEAARLLLANACVLEAGEATLDPSLWSEAEGEVRLRALGVLIAAIAGAAREPAGDALERLDKAMSQAGFAGAALGGALIRIRRGQYRLCRDPGAVLGRADGATALTPLILQQGEPAFWDHRLSIIAAQAGGQIIPGPEGAPLYQRAGVALTLAEAEAGGEIRVEWLIAPRLVHFLSL